VHCIGLTNFLNKSSIWNYVVLVLIYSSEHDSNLVSVPFLVYFDSVALLLKLMAPIDLWTECFIRCPMLRQIWGFENIKSVFRFAQITLCVLTLRHFSHFVGPNVILDGPSNTLLIRHLRNTCTKITVPISLILACSIKCPYAACCQYKTTMCVLFVADASSCTDEAS